MKKIISVISFLTFVTMLNAEPQLIQGALTYFYQLKEGQTLPASNQDSLAVIVHAGDKFEPHAAIISTKETQKLNALDFLGISWEGYIKIEEDGTYTFALKDADGGHYKTACTVILNDKQILFTNASKKKSTDSKSLKLGKGYYKIKVFRAVGTHKGVDFNLFYWNKNKPLKKFEVQPMTILHAE